MEANGSVKATCNWKCIGGCEEIAKAIQTKITHEDIFIKPQLDDVLSEDRALLLGCPGAFVPCELAFRVFPRYKIEALTIVCTVPKLELFLGPDKEYLETVHGERVDDDDNEEEPLLSYRYDIEIEKSGCVDLSLKLLSCTNKIYMYGIVMQIAPNPNGITTLLPTAVNLDNVQQMLNSSQQKLSPSAEKCKLFMQIYSKHAAQKQQQQLLSQASSNPLANLEQMKEILLSKTNSSSGDSNEPAPTLDNNLKSHIDKRMEELETRINGRLDRIEAEQSMKFERILKLLEEKN